MSEKLKRISFLDGLRGVAILMVVLFHAYARWPDLVPYGDKFSRIVLFRYGSLGVYLFFMISGFVILMSLEKTANFFQFIYHRWLRLFPAMFIVSLLIFVTARGLFPERPAGIPNVKDLLSGLTFIDASYLNRIVHSPHGMLEGSFWSLFVEVKFYIIFGLIFFTFGENMAIASLIGLFICDILIGLNVLNKHFGYLLSTEYMGWFASGAIYYLYFKSGKKKLLYMGLLMSLICSVYFYCLHIEMGAILAAILMSLFFFTIMMTECLQSIIGSRILLFLGFISYPLYLVHENMMVSLIIKIGRWMPFIPGFLLPIIPIAFVIVIAGLVAKYAEPGFRDILRWILERS
jgi:peptidoglycan/LPS O-acetylase OafA/YrhL